MMKIAENIVVKYNNDLNNINFRDWSVNQQNFLFTIFSLIKEKELQRYEFRLEDIKSFLNIDDANSYYWKKQIKQLVERIFSVSVFSKDETSDKFRPLFREFKIDYESNFVSIVLDKESFYIFNDITKNFTVFELKEFVALKTSPAKAFYRLIKQWRTIGKVEINVSDLRILLKMSSKNSRFKEKLTPIFNDLEPFIQDLKYELIRRPIHGSPVEKIKITWKKELTNNEKKLNEFLEKNKSHKKVEFEKLDIFTDEYLEELFKDC